MKMRKKKIKFFGKTGMFFGNFGSFQIKAPVYVLAGQLLVKAHEKRIDDSAYGG